MNWELIGEIAGAVTAVLALVAAVTGLLWKLLKRVRRKREAVKAPSPVPQWYWTWLSWQLGENEFKSFGPRNMKHRPRLPFGGKGQKPIPQWAWTKQKEFVAARKGPVP